MDLVKATGLTAQTIAQRIKNLEKSENIKGYTVFIDYAKLDVYQYSIFIINKNVDRRKKLLSYLSAHKDVCFICEYVGDQFLEFGVFVSDPYALRNTIRDIEQAFPGNRIIEHSLQKEVVSIGPPPCVFE